MKAFTHIPSLNELIGTKGRAGVEYAIIEAANVIRAHDEGWMDLAGGTLPFPIEGPKGSVPCLLKARGKPIPGQQGSVSHVFVDKGIREKTGLGVVDIAPEAPPGVKPVKDQK